jgi:hypothetical protein
MEAIQINVIHIRIFFPFIKIWCLNGKATITYRSTVIEAIVNKDPHNATCHVRFKLQCTPANTNGPSKETVRSQTARLETRYVAECLKHLRGSFAKATKSSTWQMTPHKQIKYTEKYFSWSSWSLPLAFGLLTC